MNARTIGVRRTAAEELRLIVCNLNDTDENFNDGHSIEELIQIGRMLLASDWDIAPHKWTKRQVREALRGVPPAWDANERPVYRGRSLRGSR